MYGSNIRTWNIIENDNRAIRRYINQKSIDWVVDFKQKGKFGKQLWNG